MEPWYACILRASQMHIMEWNIGAYGANVCLHTKGEWCYLCVPFRQTNDVSNVKTSTLQIPSVKICTSKCLMYHSYMIYLDLFGNIYIIQNARRYTFFLSFIVLYLIFVILKKCSLPTRVLKVNWYFRKKTLNTYILGSEYHIMKFD